jgi:FlaG/FlaF family flagellin (archaellin)
MDIFPKEKKMTNEPPARDAPPPPDEGQFSELVESTPNGASYALKAILAVLFVSIVVILAAGFIAWRYLDRSPTPTPQPAPSSRSAAQPAPTAQPAPASQLPSTPTEAYVRTPWGTRCQIGRDEIVCDTCEPGLLLDTPAGTACPGPSLNQLRADASGASLTPPSGVILPESPNTQQLSDGQTYHLEGWTIAVSGWVRFTNDATGHGVAVAAQNLDSF